MVVICPKCKARLKVADEKVREEGIKVRCPKCQAALLIRRPAQKPVSQPSTQPISQPVPETAPPRERTASQGIDRKKIVVAHDGEVIKSTIETILTEAGYQVVTASDGVDAMIKINKERPFLALLDVALPRIYGFEVCRQIKSRPETRDILVILIASIYDTTKYKRGPTSLYGADDYIEKHHIEDALIDKIRKLTEKPAEEKPPPIERVVTKGEFKEDEISQRPVPSVDSEAIEKAKRFARIVISDIALYNQHLVEKGIRNDSFYSVLDAELQEGRELYNNRVPPEIRDREDYFRQAIDEFIDKKKKTMGLA